MDRLPFPVRCRHIRSGGLEWGVPQLPDRALPAKQGRRRVSALPTRPLLRRGRHHSYSYAPPRLDRCRNLFSVLIGSLAPSAFDQPPSVCFLPLRCGPPSASCLQRVRAARTGALKGSRLPRSAARSSAASGPPLGARSPSRAQPPASHAQAAGRSPSWSPSAERRRHGRWSRCRSR